MTPTQPSQAVEAVMQNLMKLADKLADCENAATLLANKVQPQSAEYTAADTKYLAARQELETALRAELARPQEVAAPVGEGEVEAVLVDFCRVTKGAARSRDRMRYALERFVASRVPVALPAGCGRCDNRHTAQEVADCPHGKFCGAAPKQGDAKGPDSFHSDSGASCGVQAPGPTVDDLQRELLAICKGRDNYETWARVSGQPINERINEVARIGKQRAVHELRLRIHAINPDAALYFGWCPGESWDSAQHDFHAAILNSKAGPAAGEGK